jgi:peptidyl-tRNA hydrolase, PTH1 family
MPGWLVVGLGNPGPEYEWSPHNMGFLTVDRLADAHGIRMNRRDSQAIVGVGQIAGQDVMLAQPQTFMNLSGVAVRGLVAKHEFELARVIVVYDELDLPFGSLRIRPRGSAAGHNGMKSVVSCLASQEFPRVRIGIHPDHPLSSGTDYLLTPVRKGQRKEWNELIEQAARAVESIIADGVELSMTKFNRRAGGLNTEER